ncbi:hypothetical protein MMC06_005248 [Schaereria dolodes]|nr:hypothetical protein [Schaereria dolodes]
MRRPDSPHLRVDAQILIPGRGPPIHKASLICGKDKIVFVGATITLPPQYTSLPATQVPILMPGLWDCHAHFVGCSAFTLDAWATTPPALAGARGARDIAATLNAGFTSVRELAGYGVELDKAVREGWLQGPNIYSAIAILSQTGGHGDARSVPLEVLKDSIATQGLPLQLCDGVDECVKAVRIQVRRGAKVIKVTASGGVASIGDSIHAQQFSDRELRAIVEETERCERVVAAHCLGRKGIMAALRAGCHTIEHGAYLDEESVQLMLKKRTILVATRSTIESALKYPEAWSKEAYAQMVALADAHAESYAMAVKAGVRIALGTDLGISSLTRPWNHGMNGGEFGYAVKAGMTPLEAVEAGTANAPETLGMQAPLSGQLKVGYDADFIALKKNPLEDIGILARPEMVSHVWKGGELCKVDGKLVSIFC